MVDTTLLTLIEAVVLLGTNGLGGALAALAWCVSDVDVREARRRVPRTQDAVEALRLRHNWRVIAEDARFGEAGRLVAHVLIALVGVFWILTPQPVNPAVIWWAVAIRAVVVALSVDLIVKSLHHMIGRYRFDKPWSSASPLVSLWPALRLAWADMQARNDDKENSR